MINYISNSYEFTTYNLLSIQSIKKLDLNENMLESILEDNSSISNFISKIKDSTYCIKIPDKYKCYVILNLSDIKKEVDLIKFLNLNSCSNYNISKNSLIWYVSTDNEQTSIVIKESLSSNKFGNEKNKASYDVLDKNSIISSINKKKLLLENQKQLSESNKLNETKSNNNKKSSCATTNMSWRKSSVSFVNDNSNKNKFLESPDKLSNVKKYNVTNTSNNNRNRYYSEVYDNTNSNQFVYTNSIKKNSSLRKGSSHYSTPKKDKENIYTVFYQNLEKNEYTLSDNSCISNKDNFTNLKQDDVKYPLDSKIINKRYIIL